MDGQKRFSLCVSQIALLKGSVSDNYYDIWNVGASVLARAEVANGP